MDVQHGRSTIAAIAAAVSLALGASGCTGSAERAPADPAATGSGSPAEPATASIGPPATGFPPAPATPTGDLDDGVAEDLDVLTASLFGSSLDVDALDRVVAAEDPRLGWYLSDLMRFSTPTGIATLARAFGDMTGVDVLTGDASSTWGTVTDHLIAWDLPAWPGYRAQKGALFTQVEPSWAPFFDDVDATVDWRWVSWGGVLIDDRPLGDDQPCPEGCIPALDDPPLVPAGDGDWYPDDEQVFGIVVGDEAVALPRNQMQVHEMVNITVGGTRLGIPYCTLCNSAQAWITGDVADAVPGATGDGGDLVLRTSGLLSRSNKVMYDLTTQPVLDTFTGEARSGPLQDAGVELAQVTVVASTWGAWKRDHPATRIIAEDGAGRTYPLDPLRCRDDDGPIFPTGPVDPRLPVQADVVGAVTADGTPVAFPTTPAVRALQGGGSVGASGLEARLDGDGLRIVDADGAEVVSHEAFWFAWSQFHPTTEVWSPPP